MRGVGGDGDSDSSCEEGEIRSNTPQSSQSNSTSSEIIVLADSNTLTSESTAHAGHSVRCEGLIHEPRSTKRLPTSPDLSRNVNRKHFIDAPASPRGKHKPHDRQRSPTSYPKQRSVRDARSRSPSERRAGDRVRGHSDIKRVYVSDRSRSRSPTRRSSESLERLHNRVRGYSPSESKNRARKRSPIRRLQSYSRSRSRSPHSVGRLSHGRKFYK